jgi:hypothetical protein
MSAPAAIHFYRRASKLVVPTMNAPVAILLNFLRLKLRWTGEALRVEGRQRSKRGGGAAAQIAHR